MRSVRAKTWARGCLPFLVLLLLWSAFTYTHRIPEFFLPTPTGFLKALAHLFFEKHLLYDMLVSIGRVLAGFVIAVVLAVPLGILLGTRRKIEQFLEPLVDFIRYTPTPALIPLFILWFGIGETEKIVVIAQSVFFQLVLLVASTVSCTPKEIIESAQTLGASRWQILTRVITPHAAPRIYDDLRICLGWAWSVLMMAEIVGATSGLGLVIIQSQRLLRTGNVTAVIVVVGVIGLTTDVAMKHMYPILFPWAPKLQHHA